MQENYLFITPTQPRKARAFYIIQKSCISAVRTGVHSYVDTMPKVRRCYRFCYSAVFLKALWFLFPKENRNHGNEGSNARKGRA